MKPKKKATTKKKESIPDEIKAQVEEIVRDFNSKVLRPDYYYVTRYKGIYLYLDLFKYYRTGPISRLKYTGKMDGWEFAIYKYSDDQYDPHERMFPGTGNVDGTVEGAMRAGIEAYP